jgi:hypothetical protein
MTHEELHEWARANLLPHENTETQLRFAEGEEGYDDDYILEKYNENERMNKSELKEQLQENLLAYFDGYLPSSDDEDFSLMLDGMCEIVVKTIDRKQ